MRILWVSNAPWAPSGYGEQAALFLPRLRELGHEMACMANFGLNGATFDWNGLTVYPSDNEWGNVSAPTYAQHHDADLILVLHDAWVLHLDQWPDGPPVAVWAPVDHGPIPPPVLAVLAHQRVRPIAMSRFGETWMRQFGLDPQYVPHGVDTTVFRPQPEIKAEIRAELGIPEDAFVVGMVAANQGNPLQPRKGWPQAFDAFARFARDHDDAYLYAHTRPKPRSGSGIDLDVLARAVGAHDRILFANEDAMTLGMPPVSVAATYAAFDVLLNPSYGEGFGIPIIEAQACGVPVIVSDHSAMTELCGAGWLVEGDRMWDPAQQSFFFMPHVQSIAACLEAAYQRRDDAALADKAESFAAAYDADVVAERHWKPALEALSRPREAKPLTVNGGLNRHQRRALAKAAK